MHPRSLPTRCSAAFLVPALGLFATRGEAQVVILPELMASYAAWPAPRESAPEDPTLEPLVSLAGLVLALAEAIDVDAITLERRSALELQARLTALIDAPVLPRARANQMSMELAEIFSGRQFLTLVTIAQKRDYASRPGWLGAFSATANPFYNPGSVPGDAARFVLARLDLGLREQDGVNPR